MRIRHESGHKSNRKSHVNMGVGPSGQDDDQAAEMGGAREWFIRGIFNKKGEAEFTLYYYKVGVVIRGLEWAPYFGEIDTERKDALTQEIKDKVATLGGGYKYNSGYGKHATQGNGNVGAASRGFRPHGR